MLSLVSSSLSQASKLTVILRNRKFLLKLPYQRLETMAVVGAAGEVIGDVDFIINDRYHFLIGS